MAESPCMLVFSCDFLFIHYLCFKCSRLPNEVHVVEDEDTVVKGAVVLIAVELNGVTFHENEIEIDEAFIWC